MVIDDDEGEYKFGAIASISNYVVHKRLEQSKIIIQITDWNQSWHDMITLVSKQTNKKNRT